MARPIPTINENRRFDDLAAKISMPAMVVGLAAVALSAILAAVGFMGSDWAVFFRSYILNFALFNGIVLGALFFTILQYLTTAAWSVVVRRIAESTAAIMPWMAVLFLPILIPALGGMDAIYPWASAKVVAEAAQHGDAVLANKSVYLSLTPFLLKMALVFTIWSLLARFYYNSSIAQDSSGDVELTRRMQFWSGPCIIVFAFTLAVYAIDVLMGLNPKWFSTMWPVYIFAGCWLSFMAYLAIMLNFLQSQGRITQSVTPEHYHDVGKWVFALVVFWTYITFSQFMLIWYANIPEETVWLIQRQKDSWWKGVSLFLLFGQFVFPFLYLIKREVKRNRYMLLLGAVWIILMRWTDLYYIVIPRPFANTLQGEVPTPDPMHWIMPTDVLMFIGIGGLFISFVATKLGKASLIPERDPRLPESLALEQL